MIISEHTQDTEYLMYVVDLNQGALRSKKPTAVRGRLLYTLPLASGVAYVTSHEVNVLNPATGALMNKPMIRSKRPVVATRDAHTLYAFTQDEGMVYKLDIGTGKLAPFATTRVKLQGKDAPLAIEKREDGLVVLGQQSVVGWSASGEVAFESHHPAPMRNAFLRALLYAQAARTRFQASAAVRDFVFTS